MGGKTGFTLIEVIIVMGIVAILSMVAIPNLVRMKEIYVVRGEMQRIIAFISLAKSAALKHNEQIGVDFSLGKGITLTMYRDSNRDAKRDAGEETINTLKLDAALEIEKLSLSGLTSIATNPTGTFLAPGNFGSIGFKYNQQYRKLTIASSGRITITREKLI